MEDIFSLLWEANQNGAANQRELARNLGMSVGKVNSLLKEAEEQSLLDIQKVGKQSRFCVLPAGRRMLEQTLLRRRQGKLRLEPSGQPVKTAVILAAGSRSEFEGPTALLPLGDSNLLETAIQTLESCGIERFYVIAGYQADQVKEKLAHKKNAIVIENPRYKWSGTMQSLQLLAEVLTEDFLILKSDLAVEKRGPMALLEGDSSFRALLAAPSGRGDEAFVELDEDGDIFRISKDIHQINRVQGELVGMMRVPAEVFRMMLRYFEQNENPYLNFEYVLENIGRLYGFRGEMVDDLIWSKVETRADYQNLVDICYPRILRKQKEMQEKLAADTMMEVMGIPREEILEIGFAGGLTNTSYDMKLKRGRYILRLPGRMTETMIDRVSEKQNAQVASDMGINCKLIYCNAETGVKVSEYIDRAETLSFRTAKLEENMKLIAEILHRVHDSDFPMHNRFDPFAEAMRYEKLLSATGAKMYKGYEQLKAQVFAIRERLLQIGYEQKPCHNDLLAFNLVKDGEGRLYLIDWEYAGINDPMFDLASYFLENEFTAEDEELFFHYYFPQGGDLETIRQKILIFKISQDFLWSIWTVLKEAKGDDFGAYGPERFARCQKLCTLYWETYGD
ncbi:MAG: phosphotransferase [Candidatus Merdivicinus sp.]